MANLFEPPRFIAVEGPIRAGKSTLARTLAEKLYARHIAEPEYNPFLDRFYAGERGQAFATQMWFLEARWNQLRVSARVSSSPVVSDYIFEKDKIFACMNLNDAELALYNRYYSEMRDEVPQPDLVIYLEASPEVLKQRLKRKNLPQERAISDAYVEQVAEAYRHFFFHYTQSDLLVVDTNDIDFVTKSSDLETLFKRLEEPVKGTQYFLPLSQATEREKAPVE